MKLKLIGTAVALMITAAAFAQLGNPEDKSYQSSVNRVENMCQTVKLAPEAKQQAIEVTYNYFSGLSKLRAAKASKEELDANAKTYFTGLKKLIPADQMEAYKAWSKLSSAERTKPVAK